MVTRRGCVIALVLAAPAAGQHFVAVDALNADAEAAYAAWQELDQNRQFEIVTYSLNLQDEDWLSSGLVLNDAGGVMALSHPVFMAKAGAEWHVPSLQENAWRIHEINRVAAAASLVNERSEFASPFHLFALTDGTDRALDASVLNSTLEAGVQVIQDLTPDAESPDNPEEVRRALKALIMSLVDKLEDVAMAARRDNKRMLRSHVAEELGRVQWRVAAVFHVDEDGDEAFRGSAVIIDGATAYTAAHVVALPDAVLDTTVHPRVPDFSQFVLALPDDKGRFAGTPRLQLLASSRILPTLDAAVLSFEADHDARRLLDEYLKTPLRVSTKLSDVDQGVVFGYSAASDPTRPSLTYLLPGEITFPMEAKLPTVPKGFNGDIRFLGALLSMANEICPFDRTFDQLTDLAEGVIERYDGEIAQVTWRLRLGCGYDDLQWFTDDESFIRDNMRIVCFGVDVATNDGCSGAPLFKITDPPVLVGIVSGASRISRGVAGCNGEPPVVLRSVPIALVLETLEDADE